MQNPLTSKTGMKPDEPETIKQLSTIATDDDLENAVEDEFGAKYSKDGTRLMAGANIEKYEIRKGTEVICEEAFYNRENETYNFSKRNVQFPCFFALTK